jgi:GNAT superfamily N-acetyltransferase
MSSTLNGLRIAPAEPCHLPVILSFIRKLAEYEKLLDHVTADEESLRSNLFGANHVAEAVLAWCGEEPAGFAVYFRNFSTFLGRPGIYLEDLFVEPAHRGKGIGTALLRYLARVAKESSGGRLEWAVLDWNQPAIDFYRRLGAVPMEDWTIFRATGDALDRLAGMR